METGVAQQDVTPLPERLARLRDGDADSLRGVIDEFGPKLLNFVYRMVGDRSAAEDLTQEVFVKLLSHADEIRDERLLGTWLYSVARNHSINHLRSRKTAQRNRPEPPAEPSRPDEAAGRRELAEAVQRALDGLEEPFRTTFVLCVMQEMSYEEAAQAMSCSVKTVSSRLFRARDKFRELMRPYLYEVR